MNGWAVNIRSAALFHSVHTQTYDGTSYPSPYGDAIAVDVWKALQEPATADLVHRLEFAQVHFEFKEEEA